MALDWTGMALPRAIVPRIAAGTSSRDRVMQVAKGGRTGGAMAGGNGNMQVQHGRVLLILPYFGSFGPWFPLFLQSLANQQTLDLLLLSDTEPTELPTNVRRVEMTLDQVRELATGRLGTPVRLERTRNICDLKPAYGMVFAEFTQGYEYWAFGDEDVLYGDLDRMLAPHLDGTTDLITPSMMNKTRTEGGIQGHLTVLRNDRRTNELAISDPAYKQVLVSQEHWAYDENSWRRGPESSSFTKVVKEAEARGELSIHWGLPAVTHVPRPGRWYVYDGRTLRADNGVEFLYYHWGRMRHRNVQWPGPEQAADGVAFDRYGFYDPELGPAPLAMRRAMGRVRELASDARRRLSKWRAARRAASPAA